MRPLDRFARMLRLAAHDPLPAGDGYALWAGNYPPRPHNPLMEAEQSVVEPLLVASISRTRRVRAARALDVGTGTGRYLPLLRSAGAGVVVGLDMSMAMLDHNACGQPRVCADACRLPFAERSFDIVCSSLMAGDVEDLGSWVLEAGRVLEPGGDLVYSDFHPSWSAERWRRTFRSVDGRQLELSYFPHSIDQHLTLLERGPFEVRTIREPRIKGLRHPVVVVFHAIKRHPARQPLGLERC